MPLFTYTARARTGEMLSGEVDLPNRGEVIGYLRRQRLIPLEVKAKPREINLSFGSGVTRREVVIFTRQFSTMVAAGLPLVQSLAILADQTDNPRLRTVIRVVLADVQAGRMLAEGLRRHPKVFGDLYVNMVSAGEAGGILDVVLERLAVFLEKNDALLRKVQGAMAYPAVMLFVVISASVVLIWKVVPIFAGIFEEAGLGLPAPTRAVLALSDLLQSSLHLLVIGIVVAVVGVRQYVRTGEGRLAADRLLLRLPVAGPLLRKAAIARFTRTLGTLVSSGVPILEGLEITARTAGNRVVHDAVLRARFSIAGGASIADPLRGAGVFPPMVVQMIHVGEQTGALDEMLGRIADFYDDEVDVAVSALTSVLEPILIVIMGVVVGGLVVAMYLPMFDLIQTVQG